MAALIDPNDTNEVHSYRFKTYGVRVVVNSNYPDMIEQAAAVAKRSLLGKLREMKSGEGDLVFDLIRSPGGGSFRIFQNGTPLASGRSRKKFFSFFDSVLRAGVGEFNVDRVFIHAGVVGWKGKAILMPADSFQGKSTLVAELVRQGASYYSDDFAIFDEDGLVHPFPRPLSLRSQDGNFRTYELTPEDLGGGYGNQALPVGLVLFTGYSASARWSPKIISPGAGVLELMKYALPLRRNPDFSLKVLNKIASRAIIASGRRGTAEKFSTTLLKFVDKHVN